MRGLLFTVHFCATVVQILHFIIFTSAVSVAYDESSLQLMLRNKVTHDGIEKQGVDAVPAFLNHLYDFIQSDRMSSFSQIHLLANPCQNVSRIENETRVSFVLDDDEFANLKQNFLIVAVDEYEHECEQDHESLVDEMAWTQKSISLESPSDGIVNLTRWDYENATKLGRYKIFNVTDIVSRIISETNVNNLARKSSTVIGFHIMNVRECISIESGNSSPLLVAFDDFEFGNIETDFFLNQRENSEQKSAPLMPRLRDAMKVRNRRKTPDTSCQVRDWYVDFTEVGLDHLIYVPSGYHANFCDGSCHFEHFQTEVEETRDAIVRGISRRHIHSHDQCDDTTMPPCATCVPSSFAPLTLIYRTERSNFVIDSAQNMTVTACTCV